VEPYYCTRLDRHHFESCITKFNAFTAIQTSWKSVGYVSTMKDVSTHSAPWKKFERSFYRFC